MLFFRWFQRSGKAKLHSRKPQSFSNAFRPGFFQLDDRINPSSTATHFLVLTPEQGIAGSSSPVEIVALDASNHIVPTYTGTVNLTATDGTIPATYTFTSSNRGIAVVSETLATTGTDTVTATNSTTASITGSASLTVAAARVATHFAILVQPQAYAGSTVQVEVVALDASNHIVQNYIGTVSITSSDGTDTLPTSYTFTASDRGVHVFTLTAGVASSDTITATDTATSTITGTASLTIVAAPVATHFAVLVQPQAYAGSTVQVTVVALDASNHIVQNYTGTVSITSSDGTDTLPTSYTFKASDRGVHSLTLTVGTASSDTITATDTTTATITGTALLTIQTAPVATHFAVVVQPQAYAGSAVQVAVVALDASNHIVQNYTGTVAITSSDGTDTLPSSYTFTASDRGVHIFTLTAGAAGSDTITATDTTTSTITGTASLTIKPAQVATHLVVITLPKASAGLPTEVEVLAVDSSNHLVAGYTGTVQLSSTNSGDTLPASYTFTSADNGIHIFTLTPASAGTDTITATDTTTASITGTVTLNVGSAKSKSVA